MCRGPLHCGFKYPCILQTVWEFCCFLHLLQTNSATLLPSILRRLPWISQSQGTERSPTQLCWICDTVKIKDHIICYFNRFSLFLVSFLCVRNRKWPKQVTRCYIHTLQSSLTPCIMNVLSLHGRTVIKLHLAPQSAAFFTLLRLDDSTLWYLELRNLIDPFLTFCTPWQSTHCSAPEILDKWVCRFCAVIVRGK
jgi:hypothetical protein